MRRHYVLQVPKVGDLVDIVDISEATSYFKWAQDLPKRAIYLGEFEIKVYSNSYNRKDVCHKVYVDGQERWIATLDELQVVSRV
tara:strand:+ start:1156 stop:1407 length:252 start_codon:yes stop_codon:yes gene_type:complete